MFSCISYVYFWTSFWETKNLLLISFFYLWTQIIYRIMLIFFSLYVRKRTFSNAEKIKKMLSILSPQYIQRFHERKMIKFRIMVDFKNSAWKHWKLMTHFPQESDIPLFRRHGSIIGCQLCDPNRYCCEDCTLSYCLWNPLQ